MFLLIVILFCFTIFAFVVTNKGAGEVISDRGYKEYRLGDYSNWLQKRVNSTKNWKKIRSCLADSKVCSKYEKIYEGIDVNQFYTQHLSSVQSGCCKPSHDFGFTYVSPTNWTKTSNNYTNPDCSRVKLGCWTNSSVTGRRWPSSTLSSSSCSSSCTLSDAVHSGTIGGTMLIEGRMAPDAFRSHVDRMLMTSRC